MSADHWIVIEDATMWQAADLFDTIEQARAAVETLQAEDVRAGSLPGAFTIAEVHITEPSDFTPRALRGGYPG